MQEADEHEDLERRRELVAEDEQEEHQRAREEHLAAADKIDEASGRDAGEQGTDDEETRGEAGHADGSIPSVDGIGRRPEHQEEVDRVDEEVDTDVKYVVTRPEARRGSWICHDRRLLSKRNLFLMMMARMMDRRAVRDRQHAMGIAR